MRDERLGLGAALGILAVVAVLRLDATALWLDEAYSLGAVNDLGASVQGTHGTMALYYVVLWLWAQVSTATWWLRLFSVLCAAATLVLLRPVARRIGGSRLVLVALPLTALSSMFAWKATEARSYALETLITTACWYVLLRAEEAPEGRDRWWYLSLAPLVVAGLGCHGFFVMQLLPLGLVALLGSRPRRAVLWSLPAMVAGAATLAWLMSSGISNVGTTVTGGFDAVVRSSVASLLSSFTGAAVVFLAVGAFATVRAVRVARRARTPRARMRASVAWSWALVPWLALVAMWFVEPRFNPRYLAPSLPGLALLLGGGALLLDDALAARLRRGSSRVAPPRYVTLVIVAFTLVTLIGDPPFVREDWRGAARLVGAEARPVDGLVFVPGDLSRPPFEAAWREVPHGFGPTPISPARPLGRVLRSDDDLARTDVAMAAEGCARLWVVEYRVAGSVTAQLASEPAFAARFRRVSHHAFADDVEVTLFERTDPAAARTATPASCQGDRSTG